MRAAQTVLHKLLWQVDVRVATVLLQVCEALHVSVSAVKYVLTGVGMSSCICEVGSD